MFSVVLFSVHMHSGSLLRFFQGHVCCLPSSHFYSQALLFNSIYLTFISYYRIMYLFSCSFTISIKENTPGILAISFAATYKNSLVICIYNPFCFPLNIYAVCHIVKHQRCSKWLNLQHQEQSPLPMTFCVLPPLLNHRENVYYLKSIYLYVYIYLLHRSRNKCPGWTYRIITFWFMNI